LSQRLNTVLTPGKQYTTLFLNGVIPQAAWSTPSKIILPLYPEPNAQGFYSGIDATTNKDNRGGRPGCLQVSLVPSSARSRFDGI
jgi:hypothetical protein